MNIRSTQRIMAAASVLAKVAATLPDRREQHLLHAVSQVRRFEPQ